MKPKQELDELRRQYGCGPAQFYGTDDALWLRRHLLKARGENLNHTLLRTPPPR